MTRANHESQITDHGRGVVAIVPAAGSGRRFGTRRQKLWAPLGRMPLLVRTLRQLQASPRIRAIVPVVRPQERQRVNHALRAYRLGKVTAIASGGPTRQASVRRGLRYVRANAGWVLIHDAARPLVSCRLIDQTIRAAQRCGAAVAAVPVVGTIKRSRRGGVIQQTMDRRQLWEAQTPQVFRADWLRRAHAVAQRRRWQATDDAALVERTGHPVRLVPGEPDNLKITTSRDLRYAAFLLNGTTETAHG